MSSRTGRMRRVVMAAAGTVLLGLVGAAPLQAQNDPLAPPPDLGAGGVPVPPDTTAILGENNPPAGMMAIPVPPSTCAGIQQVVRSQGAILIPTGGGNAQRYVQDVAQCIENQVAKPAWIATADTASCYVGYTCSAANNDGGN